jgi:hypothetical protein
MNDQPRPPSTVNEVGSGGVPSQVDRLKVEVREPGWDFVVELEDRRLERVVGEGRVDLEAVVTVEDLVLADPDDAKDVGVDVDRSSSLWIDADRIADAVSQRIGVIPYIGRRDQVEAGRWLAAGQQAEIALGVVPAEQGVGGGRIENCRHSHDADE